MSRQVNLAAGADKSRRVDYAVAVSSRRAAKVDMSGQVDLAA